MEDMVGFHRKGFVLTAFKKGGEYSDNVNACIEISLKYGVSFKEVAADEKVPLYQIYRKKRRLEIFKIVNSLSLIGSGRPRSFIIEQKSGNRFLGRIFSDVFRRNYRLYFE
jgi:hypothetical protein